jgi:serine/threonine-protein kinase ATR
MRWVQRKRSQSGQTEQDSTQIERVKEVLDSVPAELISQKAVDCKQYARALFHLEPHIFRKGSEVNKDPAEASRLLQSVQDIYAQIDDPDGLDGILANLPMVDLNQQILSHRKAGRWTAAQTWYEIQLAKQPESIDVQLDLLTCLKESGQHGRHSPRASSDS